MNNVSLVGRLTATPELKHTSSGIAVTRFSIAVDRSFSKPDEEKQVDFINTVAWRNAAEFVCKYFLKGQRIGTSGSIRTGSYIDREGIKRYTFEIYADRVEFVEAKKDNSSDNDNNYDSQSDYDNIPLPSDEDLPF